MDETSHNCSWCSTPIPAGANACPSCGATVEGHTVTEIPGVTVVDAPASPANKAGKAAGGVDPAAWEAAGLDDAGRDAYLPPSEAVRLEMRRIALAAEIENAGRSVMSATGDESHDVGEPSREALEAFDAGALDATGPAGETDLAERARALEQEENS